MPAAPSPARTPATIDRFRGCLLGGAVGDALGAPVEFLTREQIESAFGPEGIRNHAEAYGRVGAFTDDTQMTLFTAEGILQADAQPGAKTLEVIWAAYQRWLVTQDEPLAVDESDPRLRHGELHAIPELRSRRAPGWTCVSGLVNGDGGRVSNDSKGCGGVMRAAPCGMTGARWGGSDVAFALGVGTAALTHGHPSGSLAAGALATIVHVLCAGGQLEQAIDAALAELGEMADAGEVISGLHAARRCAAQQPGCHDGLVRLGEGWVAEETLAIAVYCALSHPDDFEAAVRLAANHSGDCDSTAAVTGNVAGALLGVGAIPERWLDALELRDTVERLATAMHRRFVGGESDVGWRLGPATA